MKIIIKFLQIIVLSYLLADGLCHKDFFAVKNEFLYNKKNTEIKLMNNLDSLKTNILKELKVNHQNRIERDSFANKIIIASFFLIILYFIQYNLPKNCN